MYRYLILGDILTVALITIIGFSTHGELESAPSARMLMTFFPVLIAWFLLSPWFGLFVPSITADARQLWRVPLVMIFAGPLAALLRAIILNSVVIPIFAIVLSTTSALGFIIWRGVWWGISQRTQKYPD